MRDKIERYNWDEIGYWKVCEDDDVTKIEADYAELEIKLAIKDDALIAQELLITELEARHERGYKTIEELQKRNSVIATRALLDRNDALESRGQVNRQTAYIHNLENQLDEFEEQQDKLIKKIMILNNIHPSNTKDMVVWWSNMLEYLAAIEGIKCTNSKL